MKDIGIKRICVSVSELEKSLAFFTGEMELTEVCRGRLDEQTVAAMAKRGLPPNMVRMGSSKTR